MHRWHSFAFLQLRWASRLDTLKLAIRYSALPFLLVLRRVERVRVLVVSYVAILSRSELTTTIWVGVGVCGWVVSFLGGGGGGAGRGVTRIRFPSSRAREKGRTSRRWKEEETKGDSNCHGDSVRFSRYARESVSRVGDCLMGKAVPVQWIKKRRRKKKGWGGGGGVLPAVLISVIHPFMLFTAHCVGQIFQNILSKQRVESSSLIKNKIKKNHPFALLLFIAFVQHYALLLSRLTAHTYVAWDSGWATILLLCVFLISMKLGSGVLIVIALFGCCMAGATWNCCCLGASSVYTIQPYTSLQYRFIQSHICRVYICVFNCNLQPALLAEWPGSFTCYCGKENARRTNQNSVTFTEFKTQVVFSQCTLWPLIVWSLCSHHWGQT